MFFAESRVARGLARFCPAYLGAEPWTGSKTAISSPMLAPGATPSPPVSPAQRSDKMRSEEHTSELQSRQYLVCRLLLEKKKKNDTLSRLLPTSRSLRTTMIV